MTAVARASRDDPAIRPLPVPGDAASDARNSDGDGQHLASLPRLESAVVEAVAYADVFDWPLTPAEVHRYLPVRALPEQVDDALDCAAAHDLVVTSDGFVTLPGRTRLVAERRHRASVSQHLWPRAIGAARLVGSLPFVRLVAITGSLAVGAADDSADVDLFLVVEDGRLWLTRAMCMGIVRVAALGRLRLCPNYLLAESALRLQDRSLFTAHELVQMVPTRASAAHAELLRQNGWFREFLPNSQPMPPIAETGGLRTSTPLRRIAEAILRSSLGDRLERWEMGRKVRKLSAASPSAETRYDASCCQGHADEHGRRSLLAFHARLCQIEEAT